MVLMSVRTFFVLLFTKIAPVLSGFQGIPYRVQPGMPVEAFTPSLLWCYQTQTFLVRCFLPGLWLLRAEQAVRFFGDLSEQCQCVYQTLLRHGSLRSDCSLTWFFELLFLQPVGALSSMLIFQEHFNFVSFRSCPVKFVFKDSKDQLLMFLKLGDKNPIAAFSLCILKNKQVLELENIHLG